MIWSIAIGMFATASWLGFCTTVLGYRRMLRWHIAVDLACFIGLKILFFGTMEGMVVATIGGGSCTLLLYTLRKLTPKVKNHGT